ncbi:MAG: HepT-like ribonuclease domain-containing protein [Opitutaceae bacterium]
MQRLFREDPKLESSITDARRIIGLRNILAPGYDTIGHRILWAAVVQHLPTLKAEVHALIHGAKP